MKLYRAFGIVISCNIELDLLEYQGEEQAA